MLAISVISTAMLFFIFRDDAGKPQILQSHEDETLYDKRCIGPFFSVQEAVKMLMHWS